MGFDTIVTSFFPNLKTKIMRLTLPPPHPSSPLYLNFKCFWKWPIPLPPRINLRYFGIWQTYWQWHIFPDRPLKRHIENWQIKYFFVYLSFRHFWKIEAPVWDLFHQLFQVEGRDPGYGPLANKHQTPLEAQRLERYITTLILYWFLHETKLITMMSQPNYIEVLLL